MVELSGALQAGVRSASADLAEVVDDEGRLVEVVLAREPARRDDAGNPGLNGGEQARS